MFDQIKSLMEMRSRMERVKAELEKTTFQVESPGGAVRITMNGSQEVLDVQLLESSDKLKLQAEIKDAITKAIKRSQEIAAQKMKDVTGINLPQQ